jgi:hypothetical protein
MPDTIRAETTLIEEDTLMAESLRFESEPWTRFYLAGEIIRESRKVSGKQSHYASEDNTAPSDEMIDHYNHPYNAGSQPKDDPNTGIGLVDARVDASELQTRDNSEAQVIGGVGFETFDYGSATASSSPSTELVKGKASRKRWPSRTRISSASFSLPTCHGARWPKIPRN